MGQYAGHTIRRFEGYSGQRLKEVRGKKVQRAVLVVTGITTSQTTGGGG